MSTSLRKLQNSPNGEFYKHRRRTFLDPKEGSSKHKPYKAVPHPKFIKTFSCAGVYKMPNKPSLVT